MLAAAALVVATGLAFAAPKASASWSAEERRMILSLSLGALERVPPDPSNRVADDRDAANLGEKLFFDAGLSANGKVACATCHLPDRQFQDDVPLGRGVGLTDRRTMPLAGTGHVPFLFWDGRKDSLWSQALGPLESAVEHGGDRTAYAKYIEQMYRGPYEAVFGPLPKLDHLPRHAGPVADPSASAAWGAMSQADQDAVTGVFVNIGKAIAAYERTLPVPESRFDAYAQAVASGRSSPALNENEIAGLRLFIGKAQCVTCHNGPLLSDGHFHNTGVPAPSDSAAGGDRSTGIAAVKSDPFNCLGPWSDADGDCAELQFLGEASHETERAFKTPSLRGVVGRAPYMHAGQIGSLDAVLDHYSKAPRAAAGHSELVPLQLSTVEKRQLLAFLGALD